MHGAAEGLWAPERRLLTCGLVLMVTLVASETLAVATVLPVVSRQLGDLRLYGWVFSAFLLSSLVGIAVGGWVGDRSILSVPMVVGLTLFAAGLLLGGTARSMPVLVVARAVQGLGGGVVPATAYVAIGRDYPPETRPRMFAVLSTAWVVPGVAGPALAAAVSSAVGWRWVFLGLLPLVGAAAFLAVISLTSPPVGPRTARPPLRPLAVTGVVAGAGLALAGLTATVPAWSLAALVAGTALLLLSLRRLTPPGTLSAAPGLPATIANRGLLTFAFFAGDAYVPYSLTTVRHAPTVIGGLALTASTLTWTVGSWILDRRLARWGTRAFVRAGELCILTGFALTVATLWPALPAAVGIASWSIAGFGMGLAYSPLSVTALAQAPTGQEGATTASLQLTDVLGQSLGTGAAGAAVAAGAHGLGVRTGAALAFAIGAAVGLVALGVGRRLPRAERAPSA